MTVLLYSGESFANNGNGNGNGNGASNHTACNVSDVQVTSLRVQDGSAPTILPTPVDAFDCLGAYTGNNSSFSQPTTNLGYDEDGWLNKEDYNNWWSGHGAFVEESDLLDLDGDGDVDDPGWIRMGKDEGNGFEPDTAGTGSGSYTFVNDLFSFDDCKDINGAAASCFGGEAVSGTWSYVPPQTNPQALLDLLGGSFFDQATFIFKSASAFVMYNFSVEGLGLDPVLPGEFNYAFTGTWDISNVLGGHGLSNFELWARDPVVAQVTEPSTLALMLLSGGFIYLRRRKHK
jgi:hypothetical protein